MKIIDEESLREIKQGKAIKEQLGDLIFRPHGTVTM
jgi:hypothetical protein